MSTEKAEVLPNECQIDAAIELHKEIGDWRRKDDILRDLKKRNSDFSDYHETLLKVLAVNEFYGAGCSGIPDMADHIVLIGRDIITRYTNHKDANDHIALVEEIAQGKERDTNRDGCPVFASKFACFFIDEQDFPILDTHVERMVQFHLGQRELYKQELKPRCKGQRYRTFYSQFFELKERIHTQSSSPRRFSNKELDHYLWLAGITEKLRQNPDAKVNGDVKKKFRNDATKELFTKLFPYQAPS